MSVSASEGTAMAAEVAVLVIEDEPTQRMQAVDLVEEAGFEAVEACDADHAIRLLEGRPDIRLVFSDIDPSDGTDGMKLLRAIRDRWPPVELIVISGKRHLEARDLPLRGVFFGKPYRREDVTRTMRAIIGSPRRAA